jgi:hypothetical protein
MADVMGDYLDQGSCVVVVEVEVEEVVVVKACLDPGSGAVVAMVYVDHTEYRSRLKPDGSYHCHHTREGQDLPSRHQSHAAHLYTVEGQGLPTLR